MVSMTAVPKRVTVLLCACAISLLTFGHASAQTGTTEKTRLVPIYDAVLRSISPTECRFVVCLFSVDSKGISEDVYKSLGTLARVRPAVSDDLILEDGA